MLFDTGPGFKKDEAARQMERDGQGRAPRSSTPRGWVR
jgi:hypothetical protein